MRPGCAFSKGEPCAAAPTHFYVERGGDDVLYLCSLHRFGPGQDWWVGLWAGPFGTEGEAIVWSVLES
jgi:hypothetical protein